MKHLRKFNENLEDENWTDNARSQFNDLFTISIEPTKIDILKADSEYLVAVIELNNHDLIEVNSFRPLSPTRRPELEIKINGTIVEPIINLNSSDIENSFETYMNYFRNNM